MKINSHLRQLILLWKIMQKENSSKSLKNLFFSLSEVISYSDTYHCSSSSFSFKSWPWKFIKSSNSTFLRFPHLHIPVHFSLPFFKYIHLMMDSGIGSNFVMTASYRCISMFHFQPYCSGLGNSGDGICADFHSRAVHCTRRFLLHHWKF